MVSHNIVPCIPWLIYVANYGHLILSSLSSSCLILGLSLDVLAGATTSAGT